MDERINALLENRRQEIQQGLTDTHTAKTLFELKSITDQFRFILTITEDIKKICMELEE